MVGDRAGWRALRVKSGGEARTRGPGSARLDHHAGVGAAYPSRPDDPHRLVLQERPDEERGEPAFVVPVAHERVRLRRGEGGSDRQRTEPALGCRVQGRGAASSARLDDAAGGSEREGSRNLSRRLSEDPRSIPDWDAVRRRRLRVREAAART